MKVMTITGGALYENCYFVLDTSTGYAAVIDPGFWNAEVEKALQQVGKENVKAILLTHGHFDHTAGVAELKSRTEASVYFPEKEREFLLNPTLNLSNMMPGEAFRPFEPDVFVKEGDSISLGKTNLKVLETPGHTKGSCCYLTEEAVFSGDTLFFCSTGRTDFPTGNGKELIASLQRLACLDGNYAIYPGHEGATTLDFERKNNPYLL